MNAPSGVLIELELADRSSLMADRYKTSSRGASSDSIQSTPFFIFF